MTTWLTFHSYLHASNRLSIHQISSRLLDCIFIYESTLPPMHLSIHPPRPSIYPSIHPSLCPSIHLYIFIHLSIYSPIHISVHRFVHSVHPSIHPSINPFIRSSIYLSIYPIYRSCSWLLSPNRA